MSVLYARGSEWRKWDLHVHTPASLVHWYGENSDETWEKFIKDLEALAPEYKVLGINDYLFIDGYKRLKKEKEENNRLQNIDLLLPVIEFRLDKFAGVDFGPLKRINFHVIFSNEVDPSLIESQFLVTLNQHYVLNDSTEWNRTVDRQSIAELGRLIKSTVPPEQLVHYGSNPIEGFNNLNLDEKNIFDALKRDCFKGKFLTAVGKTEWDSLTWTDASIATKKTIINKVDLVFTAADSSEQFERAKTKLQDQGVNHKLLDCSDAHRFSDDTNKDRIGNSLTWIKADPTFEGLKQIMYEYEGRVFAGDEPPIFLKVRENPTKFIEELRIDQITGYDGNRGQWFKEVSIPINPEMVAIIGNKGSGKSALADIFGLLGESKNITSASFLNPKRFKSGGLSKNFKAQVEWASHDVDEKNLHDEVDGASVEKVKYLPQRWFEDLCNDLDGKQFSKELEKVVYTHLDESETLGYESFERLIEFKSVSAEEDLRTLKSELHTTNVAFSAVLQKLHPDYAKEIQAELVQKERELEAHLKLEPKKVENPDKGVEGESSTESAGLMKQIQTLDDQISQLDLDLKASTQKQALLRKKQQSLATLEDDISRLRQNILAVIRGDLAKELFTEKAENLVTLNVDQEAINQLRQSISSDLEGEKAKCLGESAIRALGLEQAQEKLLLKNSIVVSLAMKVSERDALKKRLAKPQEEYQKYLEGHKKWRSKKEFIEGSKDNPEKGTINFYLSEANNIKNKYAARLAELHDEQKAKTTAIYAKKHEIVEIYSSVKARVDAVIAKNQANIDNYSINIEAGFTLLPGFTDRVLKDFLNLRSKGSFMGQETAYKMISSFIEDKDFDDVADVLSLQQAFVDNLMTDNRSEVKDTERPRNIPDQLMDVVGFFDYLYGLDFLTENYQLRLDNKNLESLSPGEKGALLLVFYLMLDQDDTPLVIDQPEDNLDNQSVARILVKFIQGAKSRRQIIMVTHNPNLAVVADAEQIIYAQLDKMDGNNLFTTQTGSIENDEINKKIVDVLEGTMPAFDKRRFRYTKDL